MMTISKKFDKQCTNLNASLEYGNVEGEITPPRCKKVKFMMELHHESLKEHETSVGASPYGLPHPCELVSSRLHKWD